MSSRGGATGNAFPWNASMFSISIDPRKEAPSRLKEVLQSPTSVGPPSEHSLASPTFREESADSGIGFLINQNPVRKSVRSQSYSVGQQDPETGGHVQIPNNQFNLRMRSSGSTSLRHRPSKPSLLGENSRDAAGLAQLREDDDDIESSNGSEQGVRLPASYFVKPEQSVDLGSHALLRQAAVENARARHRASTTGSPTSQHRRKPPAAMRGMSLTESDYAIEEMEDTMEQNINEPRSALTRRFSEHVSVLQHRETPEDPIMDSPKKQHWASSLSFGGGLESQSRRHSFADVPSHQASRALSTLSNTYEEDEGLGASLAPPLSPRSREQYETTTYFSGHGPATRSVHASTISSAHPAPAPAPAPYPQNPYAVPAVISRPNRQLYMVAFKCSRADVYYIPENTGLEVKQGDMVIVEGDRGIDLGTVTHADVTLAEAKRLKDQAAEEHFRWLMMFSRHAMTGSSGIGGPNGSFAASGGETPSTVGGMGPPVPYLQAMASQHEAEIKPKMIRRLAQNHEIQVLRDKEGSEAKAKRVCQSKVVEHNLNMEILDAEYQLDFKKLTFYYFAESYINFNDLVTDLFKVYKTRIWMSAINPASFATAAGTLTHIPPPSAIGPGATAPLGGSVTGPLPVGLGFGREAFRVNEQFGTVRPNPSAEASRDAGPYYPFANQIPQFPVHPQPQQYGIAGGWPQPVQQPQQQQYNRFNPYAGGYTPTTYPSPAQGLTSMASPMNAPSYYPSTTYPSSPAPGVASSSATRPYDSHDSNWVNQFQNMSFQPQK